MGRWVFAVVTRGKRRNPGLANGFGYKNYSKPQLEKEMKKLISAAMATALAVGLLANVGQAGTKKFTIALIPGLTSDAFYITMHRGAQAAADALGVDLIFQGPPEWNAVQQVPGTKRASRAKTRCDLACGH